MKKFICIAALTSACAAFVSCTPIINEERTTIKKEPDLIDNIKGAGVFVISNRNGEIRRDCSGLGTSIDSHKYITVTNLGKSCEIKNKQDFIASIAMHIKASKLPLVIFIHGSGQDFKTALENAEKFSSLYNTNILSIDWPVGETTGNYKITHEKAGDSGKAFAPELKNIMTALSSGGGNDIAVFSHSMGNYVLQKIVESSDGAAFDGVKRVIINAADVMLSDHETWVEKLAGNTNNRVYVIINKRDQVIACSANKGELSRPKQLVCNRGVHNKIPGYRLGNKMPKSNLANGATYLDVTDIKGVNRKHEYYLGSPKKMKGIYAEILGSASDPDFENFPNVKVIK